MNTDSERLDWLQDSEVGIYEVIRIDRRPTTSNESRYEEHRVFLGWSVSSRDDECKTIREAIDIAIEES